jgi:hypothetical protein
MVTDDLQWTCGRRWLYLEYLRKHDVVADGD